MPRMMISRTPLSSPRLRPPPRPRRRCPASQPLLRAANVSATRSRGNGSGSATTGIPGLADQNQNATTGTLTGTAIAIANGRPATGLALEPPPPWTSQPGYLDLMNALMSFLNISTLGCVVIDCFSCFTFSHLRSPDSVTCDIMPLSTDRPGTGDPTDPRCKLHLETSGNHGFPAVGPLSAINRDDFALWIFRLARTSAPNNFITHASTFWSWRQVDWRY
jgi:hypothetical protein